MTSRFDSLFGGSPLSVLVKLLFLSLVVGVVMAGLGLTPGTLVQNAMDAAREVFGLGLHTVRDMGGYVVTGAIIVVPIWLATRLLSARR